MLKGLVFFVLIVILGFTATAQQVVDVQGHRGARGMMPENTVPAFLYALEQGVTTLELDVVITKDNKVVVSHEPYISSDICLMPDSTLIRKADEKSLNIYQMTYAQVQMFDCGSKGNKRFPEQQLQSVPKPLLSDVIKSVEWYIKSYTNYQVDYNIELKSSPEGDDIFHPAPEQFSKAVHNLIDEYIPLDRVVIQSFDFRILRYWHEAYPDVRLAALIENTRSITSNLASLGFRPHIYSPYYKLLSEKKIKELHNDDIKVIPWTVNNPLEMQQLVEWEVDGIITDYPNRAKELGLAHN